MFGDGDNDTYLNLTFLIFVYFQSPLKETFNEFLNFLSIIILSELNYQKRKAIIINGTCKAISLKWLPISFQNV